MVEKVESMNRAKEGLSGTVEKTKASLDEAKGKAREATEAVVREAAKASEYAKERYGVAAENVLQGYGRARKDLDKLVDDVTTYVSDNPGRSVMIAGALGFFVGFLLRGDRRR